MTETKILLAQIGAPHGIKGEVRVKPFGEPDMLDQYGKLETKEGKKFKIKRMRPQKNMMVVKFEGVNTREEAEALNRVELFIDRTKLPELEEEDEFYIEDLIGMDVLDESGVQLGTVLAVPNFGAGDMIEVKPTNSSSTYYLPFTKEVVPEIDFENASLTVVPPSKPPSSPSTLKCFQALWPCLWLAMHLKMRLGNLRPQTCVTTARVSMPM